MATVVPAVLSVCEYYDLGMDDLIRGIVIGYETGIRMGNCVQPAHRARGYHSTGTVGTLGAAMAVAATLRFSREEFKAALSAAATSAAGLNEMMENVSTLKPYNPGRACHDGNSGYQNSLSHCYVLCCSGDFAFILARITRG